MFKSKEQKEPKAESKKEGKVQKKAVQKEEKQEVVEEKQQKQGKAVRYVDTRSSNVDLERLDTEKIEKYKH